MLRAPAQTAPVNWASMSGTVRWVVLAISWRMEKRERAIRRIRASGVAFRDSPEADRRIWDSGTGL